jgi:hypothetical protein
MLHLGFLFRTSSLTKIQRISKTSTLQNSFTLLAAAKDETSFLLFLGSCFESESLLLVFEGLDIVVTASSSSL